MYRFAKSVSIIFSIIALISISAIIFLTVIIDANSFKPWITQWVKENKQRTLTFEGDIKLSFYPKLAINLGPISVTEYQQDKIFASVEKVQLSFSLLALLRKQLNAEGITIHGINATLIRFHDGRTNIDDLIAPDEEPTTFSFDIAAVEIVNTNIILQDEITNKTMTISNLNVETGRIQTDLFTKIKLTSSGHLVEANTPNNMTFDLNLEATKIQLNDGYVISEPIHLSFHITDSINNLSGKLSLSDLTQTGNQLKSNLVHFELTAQNDIQIMVASVDTPFIGAPDEQLWTLPEIRSVFSLTRREDANSSIDGQLSGDLIFNSGMETLQMNYSGKLADSPFHADFSLTSFSEKIMNLDLFIDQLNLNHFVALQTPQPNTSKNEPKQLQSKKQTQPTEQLELSFLRNLNMTGLIHIGQLQIGDIQSTDIQLHIQPADSGALTQ